MQLYWIFYCVKTGMQVDKYSQEWPVTKKKTSSFSNSSAKEQY